MLLALVLVMLSGCNNAFIEEDEPIQDDLITDLWSDYQVPHQDKYEKGEYMTDILVSGAGSGAANGVYVDTGEDAAGFGNHLYVSANGYQITFDFGGGTWILYDNSFNSLYNGGAWTNDGDNNPTTDGGVWSVDSGSSPAPTVTWNVAATFELSSAEITPDGNLKITWDIDNPPASGSTGMTLNGGHTLGDWQHSGSTSSATVTPPVLEGETSLELSYDDGTGNFEDDEGNPLEGFSDEPVTNNSTQKKKYKPIVWNSETSRMRRLREDERLDTVFDVAHQLPRVQTVGSAAQITPDAGAYDRIYITAQAAALEFKNPTGGSDGQTLLIRIKDNGTSRNLTWGAAYRGVMGNTLPSSTDASATAYIGFVYNDADGKWDLVAV